MEHLIKILKDIEPDIDYENCKDLIDGRRLDSLSIIALVGELEEEFDITIPTVEITPDNFNSVQSLWAMVTRLIEEG
ncbi:hypothetical protein SDC9_167664 [bioreactor metagenome]|uniref:Carrier domain-containing protein n=1 Tax=bioreactor metagenome TaxID=1076179 RepID=A0A645G292_9ZZZZ|nr:phosphopantetheine-binding protein [Oscillospiraceae bacterium]